jgi:hypothetical protein
MTFSVPLSYVEFPGSFYDLDSFHEVMRDHEVLLTCESEKESVLEVFGSVAQEFKEKFTFVKTAAVE